ncbi:MAG: transpeptidase family protein [Cytophagales bacterium]|nr:transpeptidase family protein [Cytophagales bacterium]
MSIKKSILFRARIAFLFVFSFAVAIGYKVIKIQYIEGIKWQEAGTAPVLKDRVVKATRGNIYSDNGSLLATSLPFYKVAFDPTIASDELYKQDIDSLCILLSGFFKDRSPEQYKRKIKIARVKKKQYIRLNTKKIDHPAQKIMSKWPVFREGRLGGGGFFEKTNERFYPFRNLCRITIGYINEQKKGVRGLEYSFNSDLAGKDGRALFQKIAGGHWKPLHNSAEARPVEGIDIHTTIDINLQDLAESVLMKALVSNDADYGCLILMEVATGEIKAMVNLRKYRSAPIQNKANAGDKHVLPLQRNYLETYNYAVADQGMAEPGSTFKLASMIALFEDSKISPTDSIDTYSGKFKYYDRIMPDNKPGGFGKITVQQAFEYSSNIGVSRLVNNHFGKNPQRFVDYIHKFGLASPVRFQIKGEGIPEIKQTADPTWSGISLPWMSIGYELKITPLQMLAFYNAVANDGEFIQPLIVKKTMRADKTLKEFESDILHKKICSAKTLNIVKKMLEGVVERGTAQNIKNKNYKIAGKTGTAQKIKNGKYIRSYYTSFVGYFPASDPKYSCIVVIDNPKGSKQYGGQVAAPVFKELADKVYATDINMHQSLKQIKDVNKGIFPVVRSGNYHDLNFICDQLEIAHKGDRHFVETLPGRDDQIGRLYQATSLQNTTAQSVSTPNGEWVQAVHKGTYIQLKNKPIKKGLVPDVRGMTLRDAIYNLENQGLKVFYEGTGRVVEQSQRPGIRALKGSAITIKLS